MKQFFEEMTQAEEATAELLKNTEPAPAEAEPDRPPVHTYVRPYWIKPEEVRNANIQVLIRRRTFDRIIVKAKKKRISTNSYINDLLETAIREKPEFPPSTRTLDSKNRRCCVLVPKKLKEEIREDAYMRRISVNEYINQVLELDIKE